MQVSVVVADGYTSDLDQVAARLRASGMAVDAVLEEVGIITGYVGPEDWAAVQHVAGVASITADRQVTLPPPDSAIQ